MINMGNEMGNQNTSGLQEEEKLKVQEPSKTFEPSMMDPLAKLLEADQTSIVPNSKAGDFQDKLTNLGSEKKSEKDDQIEEQKSTKREENEELRCSSPQQEPELIELADQKAVEQESTTTVVPESALEEESVGKSQEADEEVVSKAVEQKSTTMVVLESAMEDKSDRKSQEVGEEVVPKAVEQESTTMVVLKSALEEESNIESQEMGEVVVPGFDPSSICDQKGDVLKNEMEQTITNSSLEAEKNEMELHIEQTQVQDRSNEHEEKLNISNDECKDGVEGSETRTIQRCETENMEDKEQNPNLFDSVARGFAETQTDLVPVEQSLDFANGEAGETEIKSVILAEKKEMENEYDQKTSWSSDEHVKGESNRDETGHSQAEATVGETKHEGEKEKKENGPSNQSKSVLDSEINGDEVAISSLPSSDLTEKNLDTELRKMTENSDSSDLIQNSDRSEKKTEDQLEEDIPVIANSVSKEDIDFLIEKKAKEKNDGNSENQSEENKPIKDSEEDLGLTENGVEERIEGGLKDRLEEQNAIINSVFEKHEDSMLAEEKIEGGSEDQSEEQNQITDSISEENIDCIRTIAAKRITGRSEDRLEEPEAVSDSIPEKHVDGITVCTLDCEERDTQMIFDENSENPPAMIELYDQRSDDFEGEDGEIAKLVSSESEFIKQVIVLEQNQEQEPNVTESETPENMGTCIIGSNQENSSTIEIGEKNLNFDCENPTVKIEASALETENQESKRYPTQNKEKIVKIEVPGFKRTLSERLGTPLGSHSMEETHIMVPLAKHGSLISRKSVVEAWDSPGKKSMSGSSSSSSPRGREKQKGRSSFFSNCMCCTAVIR